LFVSWLRNIQEQKTYVNKHSKTGFFGCLVMMGLYVGPYLIPLYNCSPWATRCARNTRGNPRRHGPTLTTGPGQNPPTRQHTKPPPLDQGATSCSTGPATKPPDPGKNRATR
jgi:hypothetical protein